MWTDFSSCHVLVETDSPKNVLAKMSDKPVKEGDSVTLTCSANGRPSVTFSWFKTDNHFESANLIKKGKQIQEDQLHFTSINESDSGSYFCQAQNNHGTKQSNKLQITVLCEYFFIYINHFFHGIFMYSKYNCSLCTK